MTQLIRYGKLQNKDYTADKHIMKKILFNKANKYLFCNIYMLHFLLIIDKNTLFTLSFFVSNINMSIFAA